MSTTSPMPNTEPTHGQTPDIQTLSQNRETYYAALHRATSRYGARIRRLRKINASADEDTKLQALRNRLAQTAIMYTVTSRRFKDATSQQTKATNSPSAQQQTANAERHIQAVAYHYGSIATSPSATTTTLNDALDELTHAAVSYWDQHREAILQTEINTGHSAQAKRKQMSKTRARRNKATLKIIQDKIKFPADDEQHSQFFNVKTIITTGMPADFLKQSLSNTFVYHSTRQALDALSKVDQAQNDDDAILAKKNAASCITSIREVLLFMNHNPDFIKKATEQVLESIPTNHSTHEAIASAPHTFVNTTLCHRKRHQHGTQATMADLQRRMDQEIDYTKDHAYLVHAKKTEEILRLSHHTHIIARLASRIEAEPNTQPPARQATHQKRATISKRRIPSVQP